jgi:hypothetical protein
MHWAPATISHHGIIVVKHMVHHSKHVACALLATLKNSKTVDGILRKTR